MVVSYTKKEISLEEILMNASLSSKIVCKRHTCQKINLKSPKKCKNPKPSFAKDLNNCPYINWRCDKSKKKF